MKRDLVALKKKYVPMRVAGTITNKELAYYLGLTPQHTSVIVSRYKKEGESCFINRHTGMHYNPNRTKQELCDEVVELYKKRRRMCYFRKFCARCQ